MKKAIKSLALIMVLFVGVFTLTGCDKAKKANNTVEISYNLGKGKVTLSVPKDEDGNPKYKFTTEKPAGLSTYKTFYLVTDNAMFGFATSGMSYNTSAKYKEKYGDVKATFDGYLEFIEDKDLFNKSYLPGLEQFKLNDRNALRYYNRAGSPGDYKYYGYFYMVGVDDIYVGSKFDMVVNYKVDELPKESKEFDEETLDIIKSLKIAAVQN